MIFSGRAMEVHINNLVEPKDCRKVRELDTKHVNYLEESFLSAPGANFNLLAGNLIKGSREDVRKEGGAVSEAIGGNHTRAALKVPYKINVLTYASHLWYYVLYIDVHLRIWFLLSFCCP